MRKKQDLLRDYICMRVQEYQVAFLRRLADDLEKNGHMGDRGSECWTEFVETIADDITYVYELERVSTY